MRGTAVIGSAFGDEGKGLMTDYFSGSSTVVVRFNGGAQAGHTVVTPQGKRHVFSHIGSGAFRGAATFLASEFILNPLLFEKEYKKLIRQGLMPLVFCDKNCKITLPYDMALNQECERQRGDGRHGSCGAGINETIVRYRKSDDIIQFYNPLRGGYDRDAYREALRLTSQSYFFSRATELGIDKSASLKTILDSELLIEDYLNSLEFFLSVVKPVTPDYLRNIFDNVVFEGAQGLLLNQDHSFFPHVTHSYTGTTNVLPLVKTLGVTDLEVVYVMRAYMTRHGRGPLPTEDTNLKYEDHTNLPNDWQETLRFGSLDLDLISDAIKKDAEMWPHNTASIAITHTDQIDQKGFKVKYNSVIADMSLDDIQQILFEELGVMKFYISRGPCREDIRAGLHPEPR